MVITANIVDDVKYFRGFPLYEYDEKGNCWLSDSDALPTKKVDFLFQSQMDSYPEDGYELWLWEDGACALKSYSCYPEWSMVGYPIECGSEDWNLNKSYYEDPWNYSKELNDTSWCAVYESFEDFYKDNLEIASDLLSCPLIEKLVCFYHRDLIKYTPFSLSNISWVDLEYCELLCPIMQCPEDYQHWLRLSYGCSPKSTTSKWFDIYYPIKKKNKQRIKIICSNDEETVTLDWNHGKYGLTQKIINFLFKI